LGQNSGGLRAQLGKGGGLSAALGWKAG
jgi:hypothetical protein